MPHKIYVNNITDGKMTVILVINWCKNN